MDDSQMVKLAQELVRIPSPTFAEGRVAAHLRDAMEPIFDEVHVDEMSNVVGLLEGDSPGPTVLFNGHIDHVDPGAMEDPYSGEIVDARQFGGSGDAIYGRGSCDMKGAIASMVAASAELKRHRFAGRIVLMAVALEELGEGTGTTQAMKLLPHRPDVAISGESTAGDICLGHRGKVEMELVVKGRTCHASNPGRGINAILLMNRFLTAWQGLPMPEDPLIGRCTSTVTNITCSPGRLAVVPDRCVLTFDNRYLPGESPDRPEEDVTRLLEALRAQSPDFVYELTRTRVLQAYRVETDSPYVELLSAVVADRLGRIPGRRGWLFGTDGAYLTNEFGVPTIGFGPGNESLAHTPFEHVPVADLLLARDVYVDFVARLGKAHGRADQRAAYL